MQTPARVLKFPDRTPVILPDEAETGPLVTLARVADGIVIETADGSFLLRPDDKELEPLRKWSA